MNMLKMMLERKKKKDEMKDEEKEHPKITALNDIQKTLEGLAMEDEDEILNQIKGKKKKEKGHPIKEMMEVGTKREEMGMPVAIIEGEEEEEEPKEHMIAKKVSKDGKEEEEEDELDENGKPIGFQVLKKRIMMGK